MCEQLLQLGGRLVERCGECEDRAPALRGGGFVSLAFVQLGEADEGGEEALVERKRFLQRGALGL